MAEDRGVGSQTSSEEWKSSVSVTNGEGRSRKKTARRHSRPLAASLLLTVPKPIRAILFPRIFGRTHNLVFGETVFNYAAVVLMYTTYCVNSARTSAVLVIPRPRTKGQKMDSRNLWATCRKQMRQEGRPGFGTNLIFVGVYTSTGLAVFFKIVSVQIPSAKKRMATPRHSFFRPYLTTALCM